MKLKLFSLFLMLFALKNSLAQVSIQANQLAGASDSFIYKIIDPDIAPDPFEGSENHIWDFSNLFSNQKEAFSFINSNRTPYRNYFFNSFGNKISDSIGFGEISIQNIYQFYQKNNTAYQAMGLGFSLSIIPIPLAGQYTDRDIIYKLPIRYPDFYIDSFDLLIPVLTFGSYKQTGYRINQVNGFGLFKTDLGFFPVLRVVSEIYQTDSLIINDIAFGIPNNRIEVKFLSPDFKAPLVEYTLNLLFGNPILSEVKILEQQLKISNLSNNQIQTNSIKVYPNPANDYLIISNTLAGIMNYKIYDLAGKLIEQGHAENLHKINLENLNSGIYTILIESENQENFIQKIIIK